jgi:hypothetical protein
VPPATETGSRSEARIDTGLRFQPRVPVLVHVTHREHRVSVSDDGAAIRLAGYPSGWREAGRRIGDEFTVNISRHGVVSLPVVRVGPPEADVIVRVGQASLAFYQELLDLSR